MAVPSPVLQVEVEEDTTKQLRRQRQYGSSEGDGACCLRFQGGITAGAMAHRRAGPQRRISGVSQPASQ